MPRESIPVPLETGVACIKKAAAVARTASAQLPLRLRSAGDDLEVHRQVQTREARLHDARRTQPLAARPEARCRGDVIRAVVTGRRVHVEQVVEIDAEVDALAGIPEDLG